MKPIPKTSLGITSLNGFYSETLNVEFELLTEDDPEIQGIRSLFYPDLKGMVSSESYPLQQRGEFTTIRWYQIPLKYRDVGIKKGSISIHVEDGSFDHFITDDENGNLVYNDTIIGNCFYNSGFLFIYEAGSFDIGVLDFIDVEVAEVTFKYQIEFLEKTISLQFSEDEFNYSFNPTYQGGDLYISKVYLTNRNNDLIAVGTLSHPIKLKGHMSIKLDSLSRN